MHQQTNELHPRTAELIEMVAMRIEQGGIEAWFSLDARELLGDDADDYVKLSDTLDVWFDSGTTHYSVLQQDDRFNFPADMYLEGSDQHRGWFHSSLLASCAMHGQAPYRQVLTHGFTVDAKGMKMSKSVGNVVAPIKVTNSLGADILRLWVASTDYSGEMTISDEILKRTADSYRRIRNTLRFLLANTNGFDPARHLLAAGDMLAFDQWIVAEALELQLQLQQHYNDYQFHIAMQKIHNFCSETLGGFYLDVIKDRQYTTQADSRARRSCQSAMYHVLEAMTRWIAPILSFTADEVWENMPGVRDDLGVFVAEWYDGLFAYANSDIDAAAWDVVEQVRTEVTRTLEGLRKEGRIGSSLDADVIVYADRSLVERLQVLNEELRFVMITSSATLTPLGETDGADLITLADGSHFRIEASASGFSKCVRCWHHREDVGLHAAHEELCGRCIENIEGDGEPRAYV
jgi:isoleucyl-tRNA synthetase